MAVGGYVYTYPDVARRESLLDAMNMLEPTDTQLLSGIMQGAASNTLHEWTIDTLEAVGDNASPKVVMPQLMQLTTQPVRRTSRKSLLRLQRSPVLRTRTT
jgi:hypothetical protein